MAQKGQLKEVAWVFFKMGCVAFGGPAAHIALMEAEIVEKRQWMSREHFLDLMGATNLIPGPNSTEMTMHCGHERAGWPGLFVAGAAFVLPAVVITGVLAWLYVTYGQLPEVAPFLIGIQPVVLALIASAILKLGKKALKNRELVVLGVLTVAAALLTHNEVATLLAAGVVGMLYFSFKNQRPGKAFSLPGVGLTILALSGVSVAKISTLKVFFTFLKVGAILYGSGYVLFAYLDAELVAHHLLSRSELMNAIAVGQFTPGPVLSTATFVGYQLNGLPGALAATAGIFLPSFLLVLLLNPLVPKMRQSRWLGYFLDSVNAAAVAIMVSVVLKMGYASLVDWPSIVVGTAGFVAVFGLKKKMGPMQLVLGGAALGYLLHWAQQWF